MPVRYAGGMSDAKTPARDTLQGADRLRRAICLFLATVFIGLVVLRIGNLWVRHDGIVFENRQRAENLAHVLSEHLGQTIATIDSALSQIALHSARVGGPNARSPFWEPVLQAALAGLTGAGSISIVNDAGVITQSTIPAIVGETRGDRYLLQFLKQHKTTGLAADAPFRSPAGRGMVIPFGRRLASPYVDFDGYAVATLEPEQLRHFYRSVDLDGSGKISVLHPQGILLFHEPSNGTAIGEPVHDHPLFQAAVGESGNGFVRAPIEPGGRAYINAFRTVPRANLILAVSLSEDRALAAWFRELWNSLAVLGGLGCLLFFAGYLISREIRARAAADLALKENQARFREIMHRVPMLVSVKDTKGRIRFINKALEELFNVSRQEASGKTLHEVVSGGTGPAELISALDQEVVRTKAPLQRELTYDTTRGTCTALFVKFPLFDQDGNVDAVASFSTDLTEQRRQETWFRTIMDHAPPLIALKGLDGKFLFVNRAQEQACGVKASEFLGRRSRDIFPQDYAEMHDQFDRAVIAARAPIQREFTSPYAAGTRTLLFVKFPIFNASGGIEAVGSIATDVSKQRQAETQLVHAQRMEAVGQLTGGIAHDFNNLLTVIIGNSEILTDELKDNERLHSLAEVTLDAAERSAALTQRLLAFGRRQMLAPRPTDVKQLVEDMEDLIARAAGSPVTIDCRFADGLWPAIIDPGQLETAILNLVVNSRDAMPDGGRITIELANAELGDGYIESKPDAKPGDYIMLAVTDTGTGMPPEIAARVFEPFFTTKEVGKGTGLGLPTIYGFIKQSRGHVNIYSEVGHGTVVRLYIPRADSPSLAPELARDETLALPRGHESILLVEDDRIVRAFAEGQLLEFGYHVTTVSDPEEAMRIARLTGRPDLLLTDVVMPGPMNGRELAERMRELWPDLKVLCTSGFTDGALPVLVDGRSDGLYFLSKPFRRRDLALKVREVLDARPAAKHAAQIVSV